MASKVDSMLSMLEDGSLDWEEFGREAIAQMTSDELESVADVVIPDQDEW
jgi:hypothetical protein